MGGYRGEGDEGLDRLEVLAVVVADALDAEDCCSSADDQAGVFLGWEAGMQSVAYIQVLETGILLDQLV